MLDIISRVLEENGVLSCRIDGSVTGRDRQLIIDDFNSVADNAPSICLLTTKACGVGINLIGADRVIIFDPSWNPAEDRQAVDRAYRIGQKKDIIVYRFIMASSLEEKMYEKQVFKDGVRVVTEQGQSSRYFSSHESKELFKLGSDRCSEVMLRLWSKSGEELHKFGEASTSLPGVLGFTRHDTLYEERCEIQSKNRVKAVHPQQVEKPLEKKKVQKANDDSQQQLEVWLEGGDFKIRKKKDRIKSVIDLTSSDSFNESNAIGSKTFSLEDSASEKVDKLGSKVTSSCSTTIEISPIYSLEITSDLGEHESVLNEELDEVNEPPSVALDMSEFIIESPLKHSLAPELSPPYTSNDFKTPKSETFNVSLELKSLQNNREFGEDISNLNFTDFIRGIPSVPTIKSPNHEESIDKDIRDGSKTKEPHSPVRSGPGIIADEESEAEWDETFSAQGIISEDRGMMIDMSRESKFSSNDKPYEAEFPLRSRYKLSIIEVEEYNSLINQAVSKKKKGDTSGYARELFSALDICDDSFNLHKALYKISKRMS